MTPFTWRFSAFLLLLGSSAACGADSIGPSPDAVAVGGSASSSGKAGAPGSGSQGGASAGESVDAAAGRSGSPAASGSAGADVGIAGSAAGGTGGGEAVGGAGGLGAAGAAAGAGGATIGPQGECPSGLPGAKLIRITRADGRAACIDQREVTQGEYHAFIQAVGLEGFQALGYCASDSVPYGWPEPSGTHDDVMVYYSCAPFGYQPEKTPDLPVGCVFPCQAQAFCAWADKELCGGFDDSALLAAEDAADPQKSVWANACTNGGSTERSHASQEKQACGEARQVGEVVLSSTDEHPACHGEGVYAEIFGLSGGVAELVNAGTEILPGKVKWSMGGPAAGAEGSDKPCGVPNSSALAWGAGFRCCKRVPKL